MPTFPWSRAGSFCASFLRYRIPSVLLGLFEFVGRHGLKLTSETERCVEASLPNLRQWAQDSPEVWSYFRRILVSPHAGAALRAMHRLGVLVLLFPEFQAVDSLVIRDYYHRYTVDEHSLVAIENIHALRTPDSELERRFRDILDGLERPDLLFLALLLHDVGKGMPDDDHVTGSLQAAATVLERLRLEAGRPRDCGFSDCEPLANVVNHHAPGHLRSQGGGRVQRMRGHDGTAEDAHAAYLHRHQIGQPGSSDAMEG